MIEYSNKDVDIEPREAITRLTNIDSIINQQKAKIDSYRHNPCAFEELRSNRPYVIETYIATINALESVKHIPEIRQSYDLLEQNFHDYSQGYIKWKQELDLRKN
jgi:hypothetical protein